MEATLKTKLTQLERGKERSDTVLKTNKESAIARQIENLKEILTEVNKLCRAVEAEKITAELSSEESDQWSQEIEAKIEEADEEVESLETWMTEWKIMKESKEQEERMQFQIRLHEARLKLQEKLQAKVETAQEPGSESPVQAKLPKLTITKFNGSYTDWMRFRGEYSETIDKENMAVTTKFTYLREMLCDKALKMIEGLPPTAEGYNRAVAILKDRFGKESEIVKAYVKAIPYLPTANPKKVHDFYEKLTYNVQSLETLKRLQAVDGIVSMTLVKLSAIRGDLFRNDPNWENWNFSQFTETLRLWTRRNLIGNVTKADDKREKPDRVYSTQQKKDQPTPKVRSCVYCDETTHRSSNCEIVPTPADRKKVLVAKKLCFNCTGSVHRASDCRSTATYQHCNKRHHTSICDASKEPKPDRVMTAHQQQDKKVIYPIVLVAVDGIKTHALLDTGAGSYYASARLIELLNKRPKKTTTKRIEMMMGSTTTKVEIYSAALKSTEGNFNMNVELTKICKPQLLEIDNPKYADLLSKYNHFNGVKINDDDNRLRIPVHIVLGASEYAAIKTSTLQRIGRLGQPVAEKTLLGWTLMSPGREDMS